VAIVTRRGKLLRIVKYLLIGAAAVYAADFAVFAVRLASGSGMGTVPVDNFLKTSLKGSKEEYDYLGTASQSCSHSLFPQYAGSAWNSPCWWLARHRTKWQ